LARYLGHGGPGTAQRSYGHGLSDWCDGLIGIDGGVKPTRLRHAIWLDRMPTKAPLESGLLHAVTPPLAIPTPEWALSLMRLVALGKSPEAAGAALALDSVWVGQLLAAVRKIGAKQRLGKSKRSGSNPEDPTEFLRRITSDGWRRLLELTRLAKSRTGDAGRNEKPEPSLDLHLLVGMVGPTRQLLVWNRQQAALLHGAIESFGIPKNTYRIVPARTAKPALIALMTEIGLPPERPGTGRPVRVDPIATDESGDAMQRNRCALIIQQNRTEMVRSAIDFIPLLIAYASTRYRVGAVDRRTEDQP